MFCNFCGKNFEDYEGHEEVKRGSHWLMRCEDCAVENREEEYDWREHIRGQSSRGAPRRHFY